MTTVQSTRCAVVAATPFVPVTKARAAEVLEMSVRGIEAWVEKGVLPPLCKIGNRSYWHPNVFYGCIEEMLLPERQTAVREAAIPVRAELQVTAKAPSAKGCKGDARRLEKILAAADDQESAGR